MTRGGAGDRRLEQRALLALELVGGANADAAGVEAAAGGVGEERVLTVELRELLLDHAADEDDRQHPLARFVCAQDIDDVAAAIGRAVRA